MSDSRFVVDANGARYELGALLGCGGQGAVYAVKGGRLAVKIIDAGDAGQRDRLRRQLAYVRRLPLQEMALARPIEMLRPPHTGYVMELLTGMTPIKSLMTPPRGTKSMVEWYLQSGGLRRRLLVLARAAHVMAQIHGKGLAYSDPSPANIFISEDQSLAVVWFIDTDNLRYESSPSVNTGIYTPGFGAPEIVCGRSGVNTLTDAHALAVIAFQTLTLAHPFIGDLVNDGDPELEEQAFAGTLPWIDDADDGRNRANFGVPRDLVLSQRLRNGFDRTFGKGRVMPTARTGASEWAERLYAAADLTIPCAACGGSYYVTCRSCPWCEAARPTFVAVLIQLWDPKYGPEGGILHKPQSSGLRPVRVGQAALTDVRELNITRRLAFGQTDAGCDDSVVAVTLSSSVVKLKSCDGCEYTLMSASGGRSTTVSDREQSMDLAVGHASWRLHFGDPNTLHRVATFEIYSGVST